MNKLKQDFLNNEFWVLTFSGAFQRAGVYKPNIGSENKKEFRQDVIAIINEHVGVYKSKKITERDHCKNIGKIKKCISNKWRRLLNGGNIRIGICQKLVNLYLKYLWCIGEVNQPPHCPVDRSILNHCKNKKIRNINWTTLDSIKVYKNIMQEIYNIAKKDKLSIAEWELKTFNRKLREV